MRWIFVAAVLLTGCAGTFEGRSDKPTYAATLDTIVPRLIAENSIAGVGIAVIKQGRVTWEGYYGEQAPGVPVTRETAFNTASVAKTITAETMLSLAARGQIDLDEPIAPYVQHPDLSKDDRYFGLTPRLLLSHRGGLLNWAYAYDDAILAFDHDPGTRTSYSGAGMELVAQYAAAKTGRPLSELADEAVFAPLGIKNAALGVIPPWAEGHMSQPMDGEGRFRTIGELNPGLEGSSANSAADDFVVTVPAYAKLVASLTTGGSKLAGHAAERETLLASLADDAIYACEPLDWLTCPDAYGHSIGWQVYQWGDHTLLKHTGSDAGEVAFVYASPDMGHGAVIFVNGANGWPVVVRIIEAIGQEPLVADYYRGLFATRLGIELAPLEVWMSEE